MGTIMADRQEPTVVRNEAASQFEIVLGKEVAFAQYRMYASGIMFHHTVVPEACEGRGFGSALIRAGLAYARENGLLVLPTCPFFAAYIQRHPETHDLVHPDYRTALGI